MRLAVEFPSDWTALACGDSIALDGCCLTVAEIAPGPAGPRISFDLSAETLGRTRFADLAPGAKINLEPSMRIGDSLGGHWVTGHIDCLARVAGLDRAGDFADLSFDLPREGPGAHRPGLVAEKGSISVNGVSLTVAAWDPDGLRARAALIPETLARTNLGDVASGDLIQVEYDLLARYVREAIR